MFPQTVTEEMGVFTALECAKMATKKAVTRPGVIAVNCKQTENSLSGVPQFIFLSALRY